jgi:hypothetical protein
MKKLMRRIVAAVLIGSVITFPTRAAESPSVLLQKGIFAEETEGNLDMAIKIYEQIGAEAAASRGVVAQAKYRLALCYQKKGGKEQAVKTLNELVRQFPADAALLQKARLALAELGAAFPETRSVRMVPLPAETGGWIMAMSRDCRLVAYSPGNDVAICEVATGKTWTVAKGDTNHPWTEAQFSPDGKWIAYQLSGAAISIVKTDGSDGHKIYEGDEKREELSLQGWSRDGTRVIAQSWDLSERSANHKYPTNSLIVALGLQGRAKKEVARVSEMEGKPDKYTLTGEPGFVWNDLTTADGRYFAYTSFGKSGTTAILDLKTGREELVVDKDADWVFGWFAGDAKLLFSRKKSEESADLFAIRVKDGKPVGSSDLVYTFHDSASPLGIARDGTIYFKTWNSITRNANLWVMDGFLGNKVAENHDQSRLTEVTKSEIFGPGHTILDRKFELSATYPEGWTIRGAGRDFVTENNVIQVTPPEDSSSIVILNYTKLTAGEFPEGNVMSWANTLGPKPVTPAQVDEWLQKYAERMAERKFNANFKDYKVRADSIILRTIAGHKAVSAVAEFTNGSEPWTEYVHCVYGDKLIMMLRLRAQTVKINSLRPPFDKMIETLRMP